MSEAEVIPVADITVGSRVRTEYRHITQLAESIRLVGLLHPLVVNGRNGLVAGGRRLEAVKQLGWETVPVRRIATLDEALAALKAERDENTCREPLTPGEIVAMGKAIEAIERPEAARRERSGANQHTEPSGKFPEGSKGDTRDKVGEALGVSGKTYEKAKKVTETGIPKLVEMMNAEQVSVDAAAVVARLSRDEQRDVCKGGPKAVKAKAKELKAAAKANKGDTFRTSPEAAPTPATPDAGSEPVNQPEPPAAVDSEQKATADAGVVFVDDVAAVCKEMDRINARMKDLKVQPLAYTIHFDSAIAQVEAARKTLWVGRPAYACPYCEREGEVRHTCNACKGTGRVKKTTYDSGKEACQ